jgi:hypothetical protein
VIPSAHAACVSRAENEKGKGTVVWLSLTKRERTERNQHWTCVLTGDPGIDTSKFGPPIKTGKGLHLASRESTPAILERQRFDTASNAGVGESLLHERLCVQSCLVRV